MLRIILASVHLLALGVGLGAIYARARAMNNLAVAGALDRAFEADTWWGVAAGLWIGTGLWRALGGLEKTPGYYWSNRVFIAKMVFLAVVIAIEIWPMVTLIRWRIASAKGTLPPITQLAGTAKRIARLSDIQTALVLAMVVAATMMARGIGAR